MIRKAVLGVLVATRLAAVESFPAAADVTAASGVNIHFTDAKPGELEMLKAAGFKHLRMDFVWQATEKQRGVYDFSAYDRLTASLEKHGLKGYYILDYSHRLYESDRSVRTAEGRTAYAKWAAAAVTHFKGRGICWEFWNEPNGGFWQPLADVNQYAAMALAAAKAVRTADPDAILTGPATSTIDMSYLESCFKAGLLDYWDAVSVHPYRQTGPESVDLEFHALRRLISKYAPPGKNIPILSGEWGYSTAWQNHDPELQGKMLARQWLVNAANKIPISIWYDWHDDGTDPKEPEHHFGTVEFQYHEGRDPVYNPKPAYHAAKTFNTLLHGHRLVKRLSLGSTDHHAVLFEHEQHGEFVLAAWTSAMGKRSVRLPADDGKFSVTNHLGEALPDVSAANGMLEFTISDAPRYFHFKGENKKLSAAPEALLIHVSIVPCTSDQVIVKVENLSGRALQATVTLDHPSVLLTDAASREIAISSEASLVDFVFPLKEAPKGRYEMGMNLKVDGVIVSEIAPRLFLPPDDSVLSHAQITGEGDPKIGGQFALSQASPPEKLPGGNGLVMKLDYEFQPGWKYAAVYPGEEGAAKTIESREGGENTRAMFGMWIYGDASHSAPRLRVRDADGRTWQPSAPDIAWNGWKYVELKLDEGIAHWGGKDEKAKRGPKFPLKWEAPFLLDNPKRSGAKGSIYFTMPAVILE